MRSQELEAVSLNMLRTIKGYSDKCKWLIKYKANVVLLHEDLNKWLSTLHRYILTQDAMHRNV